MPVFAHLEGVVHVYVDRAADLEKALRIVVNARCGEPESAGAETLLVHRSDSGAGMLTLIKALCMPAVRCAAIPSSKKADAA